MNRPYDAFGAVGVRPDDKRKFKAAAYSPERADTTLPLEKLVNFVKKLLTNPKKTGIIMRG